MAQIHYRCLIMSRNYIENHFEDIRHHGNAIEQRLDDSNLNKVALIQENEHNLRQCQENSLQYILLEDSYSIAFANIVE